MKSENQLFQMLPRKNLLAQTGLEITAWFPHLSCWQVSGEPDVQISSNTERLSVASDYNSLHSVVLIIGITS